MEHSGGGGGGLVQIRKSSLRRYLREGLNEGKEQAMSLCGESAFLAKGTVSTKALGQE